ncbi:hypothetical protein Bca52824_086665 [Brassica carinata]|uniref:Uncharacterized protein n=1 Tax=Brassica carinata TaxID=52824 RepID=A0A8X7TM67_BRACI|nr:hypothetical protein Bca52824_086665 [Brassica carinata]
MHPFDLDEDVAFDGSTANRRTLQTQLGHGGMVATPKDQDKSGETLADGVGLIQRIAKQEKGNFVEMTWQWIIERIRKAKSKKEASKNGADNLPQQICLIEDLNAKC